MTSCPSRRDGPSWIRDPAGASETEYDVIVVGGGIHGIAAALEAARRGARTLLLERDDFGAATSANTLRILHGGFRYLQRLDLPRFRDSVRERSWFLRHYPELVQPMPFLLALDGAGVRRPAIFRPALALNDWLSASVLADPASRLPAGRVLSARETRERLPMLAGRPIRGGALWHDGRIRSPARIHVELLRWAVACGARALNHVSAEGVRIENGAVAGVEARDRIGKRDLFFRGARVLNCTGPWSGVTASAWDPRAQPMSDPSVAFNVVLDRELPIDGGAGVPGPGGRSFFLYTEAGRTHAGTAHHAWSELGAASGEGTPGIARPPVGRGGAARPPAEPRPLDGESLAPWVDRFLSELRAALPGLEVERDDILCVQAGVLPAAHPGSAETADRDRLVRHAEAGGPCGLVSVAGIKYTTARSVAERALRLLWDGALPGYRSVPRPAPRLAFRWEEVRDAVRRDRPAAVEQARGWIRSECVTGLSDWILGRIEGAYREDEVREVLDSIGPSLLRAGVLPDVDPEPVLARIRRRRPVPVSRHDRGTMSRTDPAAIRRVGAEPTSPLRVLVLAPHPYFIDRGTPIDLGLVLRGFSLRGDQVDVVCYAEGKDVDLPGVTLHRIPDYPAFRNMRPGFSPRKLIADVWLYRIARDLLKRRRYDVIHAGEEAVFIALWFQKRYGVPYVYDLDSSIAQQLVERMPWLRLFSGLFDSLEARAIREAAGCVPVCNALGDLCRARGARHVEVLHDITLLDESDLPSLHAEPTRELRDELGVGGPLAMYVGNLEPYQGVDLLLDAMIHLAGTPESAGSEPLHLVVVGGRADDIARARRRVEGTSAEARVTFLGPRPVSQLASLLLQADILVAPRIRGLNTPMKVFSYLHTGRCVLVTDLPTHTQVLDRNVCAMAAPDPVSFARELARLTGDRELRERLGAAGRDYVLEHHVFEAYRKRFDRFYDAVAARLREPIRTSRQSTPPTPRTTLESTG